MTSRIQITDRLALDSSLSTGSTYRPATATSAMPIDFSGGTSTDIFNDTIPGGVLGPNGYLIMSFGGIYAATAGRTLTVAVSGASQIVTPTLASGGQTQTFLASMQIQNNNSVVSQSRLYSVVFGRSSTAPTGPTLENVTANVDTDSDWTLQVSLVLSGAVNSAFVGYLSINTQFIP